MLKGNIGDNLAKKINLSPPFSTTFSITLNFGQRLKRFFSFFAKKVFDKKNATDAPMEAEMKTIIDPKYEPYKKPDNKDNQEAGRINKTIKI